MTTATPRSGPAAPKPAPPPGRPSQPAPTGAAREPGTAIPRPDAVPRPHGDAAARPHVDAVPMTGAQSLVRSLEEIGCEVVFGIPGGTILPAYDPLLDSTRVRHVLVRHEQGAGHAATGYAQATGRVGVCMATSGPGATNLVTPIADAYMDSIPMVAITGQQSRPLIGTDAFQEADITGITMPVTKHNMLVTDAKDIPRAITEAFHLASTGRPGPVLVDIPKDVLQEQTTFTWPAEMRLPGYRPTTRPHGKQIREAAKLICAAHKPVLYVGGGVLKAEASAELLRAGRAHEHPGGHHADGPRRVPGQPPAARRHAGHARHGGRGGGHAALGPADRAGRPVRRPGHRPAVQLRPERADRARGHRPRRDLQEPAGRRADRRRLPGGHRRADRGRGGRAGRARHRRPDVRGGPTWTTPARPTRWATPGRRTARCRRST